MALSDNMNRDTKLFARIVVLGLLAVAGSVGWFFYDWSCERSPVTYVSWLDSDPTVYTNVTSFARRIFTYTRMRSNGTNLQTRFPMRHDYRGSLTQTDWCRRLGLAMTSLL